MSDIDDLGEIADQCAVSTTGAGLVRRPGQKPSHIRCGSPDHMKPGFTRLYRAKPGGKFRTVCKLCDKARRQSKSTYSAQGYPL